MDESFGRRLQERREALGWSPETLAHHANMSAQQVRNIERGRTLRPHPNTARGIEDALAKGERRRDARAKTIEARPGPYLTTPKRAARWSK